MSDERRPTSSPTASSSELRERALLFSQVIGMSAMSGNRDEDVTVQGLVEFTVDIPLDLLRHTVKLLVTERTEPYVPAVGLIRQRAALEVRREHRRREGKDPDKGDSGYPLQVPSVERIPHYVNMAREWVGLPRVVEHPTYAQLPDGVKQLTEGIGRG